jgi:hypothetical protein
VTDSRSFVLDMEGSFYVARFERVERSVRNGRENAQVVVSQAKYDGTRFERSFLFDDVDLDSGSQTDISFAVDQLRSGDQLAIRLDANVSRASGKVWFKARSVHVLQPLDVGAGVAGYGEGSAALAGLDGPLSSAAL